MTSIDKWYVTYNLLLGCFGEILPDTTQADIQCECCPLQRQDSQSHRQADPSC